MSVLQFHIFNIMPIWHGNAFDKYFHEFNVIIFFALLVNKLAKSCVEAEILKAKKISVLFMI